MFAFIKYITYGGMAGIYISTVILSCILGVSLYVTNCKVNKKNLFSFIITIGVMYLIRDFIAARAQLATFILFVLEILFVECFLESKKKRYIFGLMIIAGLIANMHAAVFYFFFILLMPYIGEYILIKLRDANLIYKIKIKILNKKLSRLTKKNKRPEKIEKVHNELTELDKKFIEFKEKSKQREEKPYRIRLERRDAVKWLILACILCLAMGLLTPLGDEPYTHIFKLMSGDTTESISEHQPIVLAEHKGEIIVLILLTIFLVFTDTKITLKNLFMIGGLLVLSFMSRRQFSMLVIIGGISFTTILCDFADKYDKNGIEDFTKLVVSWKGKVVTILLIVLCAYSLYVGKIDDVYINDSSYPVKAADYILEEAEKGNIDLSKMKIFNDYNYGSYLLFRDIPVFIDSRCDLYSPEFNEGVNIFSDYLSINGLSTYYENGFNDYDITHVMTYANSKLNMFLKRDSNYKLLYSDDHFVFYERLSSE